MAQAYTVDSVWRNRAEFITGRDEIQAFLVQKWAREREYRLIKELWTCGENRIAVHFAYESRNENASGSARTATKTGSSTSTA